MHSMSSVLFSFFCWLTKKHTHRSASAAHGASTCAAQCVAALLGEPTPVCRKRPRSSGRRRGIDGRGSGQDGGAVGEAVGTRAARARRRSGQRRRVRCGRGAGGEATAVARRAGRLSGGRDAVEAAVGMRVARPDSGFKPRRRRAERWGPLSAIFE
jgi:hypothetical protein